MHGRSNATPLPALDAVVLDIEATGLDPSKARLLEVAAIRIAGADPTPIETFEQRVNPGTPIPKAATAIHGIDDAAVSGAPPFAQIWPSLAGFIADGVMIGHSVGYDLAILKRECDLAGLAWRRPRTLDTGLLAQVAERSLPGYSLDELANWLGVELGARHSALGDALTTARVFAALQPKLRERGIRTLAEAENACRRLTEAFDGQHRAGWVEVVGKATGGGEPMLTRINPYPYRHRVHDVMSGPALFIGADLPLAAALKEMTSRRVSSLYVRLAGSDAEGPPVPGDSGIITERDVMRVIAARGADALAMPISQAMSRPLAAIPADAFVYRAIGRMSRLKYRHLGVTDESGRVVGALSARDLLRLSAGEAVSLGDEIEEAQDVAQLGRAWAKLSHVAASLVAEGFSGPEAAAVISRELGALTARAAALAEQRLLEAGDGAPPCAYAVAVLGSAGRDESLLALDQDNALVFAEGDPDGPADRWFERLGIAMAGILHEVGVPYCRGGVMAKNLQWRGSLETWRRRIGNWIEHPTPQALLSVDIFFDLRGVHGDIGLTQTIRRAAFDAARDQVGFAKALSESAGAATMGFNLFGGFRTSAGRIDLKKTGLFGIVTFARVLAIRHHIVARSTPARLAGIKALDLGATADLDALAEAQAVFLDLILEQQLVDIQSGMPATNTVLVKRLSGSRKDRLRRALQAVRPLEELTHDLLFKN